MKLSYDDLQDVAQKASGMHGTRVARIREYEDIYHMKWDYDPSLFEGDWVQPLPSPDPHNAVKNLVRLVIAAKPQIKVRAGADDQSYPQVAERVARSLLESQDRRGPWMVMYDLATSAILAGESYVKVINVEDNVKFMKKSGNTGLARRYQRLKEDKPFIYKVYNPGDVFPEYSELGLESILTKSRRSPKSLAAFWGNKVLEGVNIKSEEDMVDFWEYYSWDQRDAWVDGAKNPIVNDDNKLEFLPWAGSIVEGSSLFSRPEDQRLPMLYPVLASGYWHAQSYADTIIYSLALNLGKLPQMIAVLNDPNASIKSMIDYSTPFGAIKLGIGEDLKPMEKKVIDDSLNIAKSIADSRMVDMTVPKQIFGSPPEHQLAFAALNLLNQAGRLPLTPITRMVGVIMAQMFEIPFMWAKSTGNIYEISSPDRDLTINPDEFEDVRFDVKITTSFAQDEQTRMSVAGQALASQLWSRERAMEYTGVEEPLKEKAEIDDDIERLTKLQTQLQVEAQQQMAQVQQGAEEGQGIELQLSPEQVKYRPGEDGYRLCGNCKFFRGPGVPCARVRAPISPIYTCNEWAPNDQLAQGAGSQAPPAFDPNQGGLPMATQNPTQTRETVQGRDVTGGPIG